ncbi:MAG: hypothetical protein FH761_19360 [Firmicutes bacterium]|nr:hypothetical protein [Bacillota bacterium]
MEYSVVNYYELNDEKRLDAEYYGKQIVDTLTKMKRTHCNPLEHYVDFIVGPFGSTVTKDKYIEESDYKYIRNKDINDFLIGDNEVAKIPYDLFKKLRQYHIKENDLLVTVVGTLGKVAIAKAKDCKSIFSCKSTLLRTHSINAYYLLTFLNSDIGQKLILRGKRGAIQEGLNLFDLKEVIVYEASEQLQLLIEEIIKTAFYFKQQYIENYNSSKECLLTELNLIDFIPTQALTYVKRFSDTQIAGRIDADYFQPKYDEVQKRVFNSSTTKKMKDICSTINYGTVPTSKYVDTGVPYIKGLNLINGFIEGEIDLLTNTDDVPRKFYTKENDIIISQMGTVGKAAIVTKEQENWLFASFTIRARLSNYRYIDPYVLTLYINEISRPWYLLRKIAQASVRQNTDLPTIENMLIPCISQEVQMKIRDYILYSYDSKQKYIKLLDIAKRGVDRCIQEDESTAINWMNEELQRLGVNIDG